MPTRAVFRDSTLQKQFEQKGYVVVPLLEKQDVEYLLSILETQNLQNDNGFFTTTWVTDTAVRLDTNDILKQKLSASLDKFLLDFRYHYGNYFIKKPGETSHCHAHQDWAFVEEPLYTSVTVWCALMDMTAENGCLRVLKGSQGINNYIRGRNTYNYLDRTSLFIHKYLMRDLVMKQGEAVIFNQRLIHGSKDNKSDTNRVACGLVGVPKEARIIHYVGEKDHPEKLKVLNAENDLFSRYDTFDILEQEPAMSQLDINKEYLSKKQLLSKYITDWMWK